MKEVPTADFYIKAVGRDDGGAIAYVCASLDLNESTLSELMSTDCVRRLIGKGIVFFTSVSENKKWKPGARVELYGEDRITTLSNDDESDNLRNLPEFSMAHDGNKTILEFPLK